MHGTLRLLAKASSSQSLAFCLLVIVTAFEVFAQSASTGALTGTVTDPKGAVVPKATITLRNNGTDQVLTAVTDLEGLYRFSLLPPGQYELRVEMADFAPHILREVMIQISEVRRISVKLEVPGAREVVEVKSPLLQTEGAALRRVIDGATIVALPLSSRVNQFFDTSAFVPATLMHAGGLIDGQFPVAGDGTIFGSLGRNILRGPDQHNVDAALIKHTKLTEKVGIVFRGCPDHWIGDLRR
jgi:Carboxypeptidase regulatory-like domain